MSPSVRGASGMLRKVQVVTTVSTPVLERNRFGRALDKFYRPRGGVLDSVRSFGEGSRPITCATLRE
jgi:hypothetical protein